MPSRGIAMVHNLLHPGRANWHEVSFANKIIPIYMFLFKIRLLAAFSTAFAHPCARGAVVTSCLSNSDKRALFPSPKSNQQPFPHTKGWCQDHRQIRCDVQVSDEFGFGFANPNVGQFCRTNMKELCWD